MTINGVEVEATEFAYDECHKFYIITNQEDRDMMISYGYTIYPMKRLESIWEEACPLRFISSADLKEDFVEQGADVQALVA